MKIRRLQLHLIEVRLRTPFKHAAHERQSSRNIVCGLMGGDETWGWGESLPRDYVTGETAEQTYHTVAETARTAAVPGFETMPELLRSIGAVDALFSKHPSARCAVELALIDLGAKSLQVSAADVVRALADEQGVRHHAPIPVTHSGVLGEGSLWPLTKKALKMRLCGLRQIKAKVGTDLEEDVAKIRRLRLALGRHTDLRVDANGAWDFETAVAAIGALSTFGISSVEQPLPKGAEQDLPRLRQACSVPIALDESLCSVDDAERAIQGGWADLFNVRLSKCGGMRSSLQIISRAQSAGVGVWLGCMVGESPILSAAGRALASVAEGLRHVEGSYDRHLLQDFIAEPSMTFGYGGKGEPLTGFGWGVSMNAGALNSVTKQWDHFTLR